jgi:hypothetical protein
LAALLALLYRQRAEQTKTDSPTRRENGYPRLLGNQTLESDRWLELNTAMKTSSLDQQIRSRIDSFLNEMSQLVRLSALEAVHAALGGDGAVAAPKKRGPGRPRKNAAAATTSAPAPAAKSGKRERRSAESVQATADAFLTYVKANEGQRLEQISAGMGVASKELKLPVIKLLEAKAVRTEGQKRGTMYFAGGGGKKRGRRGKKA